MTDNNDLRAMTFRLNRRQMISGMAAISAFAGAPFRPAIGQEGGRKQIPVPGGEFAPVPIAIPEFFGWYAR
jgi:TolB protein